MDSMDIQIQCAVILESLEKLMDRLKEKNLLDTFDRVQLSATDLQREFNRLEHIIQLKYK